MDFNLQMRSVDLLLRFLRHDLSQVPSYGYVPQKLSGGKGSGFVPLPRRSPEAMGLESKKPEAFFRYLDANRETLGVHSVLLLRHGKVIAEAHWAPYDGRLPHMLYSMTKSVTATALGFLMDEGRLSLEEKLSDLFPELECSKGMKELRVEQLLTMSSGSHFNELGSMLEADWARMFLASGPRFEPGSEFEYNSLNSYMLAAILERKSGESLTDYLRPRLFEKLHFGDFGYERCPLGINKGGWGLSLRIEDCAKLGQLYLQRGRWEGEQLLSEAFIDAATTKQIETPFGESREGYGYQIWMLPGGGCQFRGVFGQYVFILPQYDAVVAIQSGSSLPYSQTRLMEAVEACFSGASPTPLFEDPAGKASLAACSASFRLSLLPPEAGFEKDPSVFSSVLKALHGREYYFESNTCGLLPQILQAVHGNYTPGTCLLRFEGEQARLRISFYEGAEKNSLHIPGDGSFGTDLLHFRGELYRVKSRGLWKTEPDGEISLCLFVSFLETPNTRILHFRFRGEKLALHYEERPRVEGAAEQLFDLLGYSRTSFARRLLPAARRIPAFREDSLKELLARLTAPEAEGRMVLSLPRNSLEEA